MVNNKVCVIVGGLDAILAWSAKEMAKNGYVTAIINNDIDAAKRIADEICTFGGLAKAYHGDVDDKNSLSDIHRTIRSECGRCNVIVNCISNDSNTESVLTVAQTFVNDMLGETDCSIVNICPMSGGIDAEVIALTESMAVNLAQMDIRVNAIVCGEVITKSNRAKYYNDDNTSTREYENAIGEIPMKRLCKPEEIVGALKYFADYSCASYTTGSVIRIDGGLSAKKSI